MYKKIPDIPSNFHCATWSTKIQKLWNIPAIVFLSREQNESEAEETFEKSLWSFKIVQSDVNFTLPYICAFTKCNLNIFSTS